VEASPGTFRELNRFTADNSGFSEVILRGVRRSKQCNLGSESRASARNFNFRGKREIGKGPAGRHLPSFIGCTAPRPSHDGVCHRGRPRLGWINTQLFGDAEFDQKKLVDLRNDWSPADS
jgi:hypothetical protein